MWWPDPVASRNVLCLFAAYLLNQDITGDDTEDPQECNISYHLSFYSRDQKIFERNTFHYSRRIYDRDKEDLEYAQHYLHFVDEAQHRSDYLIVDGYDETAKESMRGMNVYMDHVISH